MNEEDFDSYLMDGIDGGSGLDIVNIRECLSSEDKAGFKRIVHRHWLEPGWATRWGDALILMSQLIELE